jgi:hypothetical protein
VVVIERSHDYDYDYEYYKVNAKDQRRRSGYRVPAVRVRPMPGSHPL